MDLQLLDPFARAHHGLVTRRVAERAGISQHAWYRAIRRGLLQPVHPNVAGFPGYRPDRAHAILAALLAVTHAALPPDIALASHRSSAWLLGVDRPDRETVDLTVSGTFTRSLDGVVMHRTSSLEDLNPTWRHRVACTNELRTLVDLGAVDPDAVPGALERFTVTRRLTPTMIARLLERHAGRQGVSVLRAALDDWPLGDDIPDSELEIAMAYLLREAGLPRATFHATVAGYEVDFLIDGTNVVIECDGWSTHVAERDQWEFDLTRDAKLHIAGYVVLRRSRRQIVFESDTTAGLIRQLIDAQRDPGVV